MLIYTTDKSSDNPELIRKKFVRHVSYTQKNKIRSTSPLKVPEKLPDFQKTPQKSKGINSMKILSSASEEFQELTRSRFKSWQNEDESAIPALEDRATVGAKEQAITKKNCISVTNLEDEKKTVIPRNLLELSRADLFGKMQENMENLNFISSGDSTPHLYVDYKHRIEGLLLLNFSSGDELSVSGSPNTKLVEYA